MIAARPDEGFPQFGGDRDRSSALLRRAPSPIRRSIRAHKLAQTFWHNPCCARTKIRRNARDVRALVTAGVEYKMPDGWSILDRFDGEFSSTTAIFAGSSTIRKVW
jgi:hypothetical protein